MEKGIVSQYWHIRLKQNSRNSFCKDRRELLLEGTLSSSGQLLVLLYVLYASNMSPDALNNRKRRRDEAV